MSSIRVRHDSVKTLPDDRLVELERRDSGLLVFHHREGFTHPDLIRDLDEISRHLTRSGLFTLDEGPGERPPNLEVWMDLSEGEFPVLSTFTMRPRWHGSALHVEAIIRAGLIRPELLREINEEAYPMCATVLHPIPRKGPSGGLGEALADL